MEIVFRKVDATTAFPDEGMVVSEAAARLVELGSGSPREPDAWELRFAQSFQELVEMVEHFAASGEKRVESNVNGLGAAKGRHRVWESLYGRKGETRGQRPNVRSDREFAAGRARDHRGNANHGGLKQEERTARRPTLHSAKRGPSESACCLAAANLCAQKGFVISRL